MKVLTTENHNKDSGCKGCTNRVSFKWGLLHPNFDDR